MAVITTGGKAAKGVNYVEYIQSSGTQWIDTGFVPNQDTRVVVEAEFALSQSTQALFGCRQSSSARQYQFVVSGGYYRTDYNTHIQNVINIAIGGKFYIDKNKNETDLNDMFGVTQIYGTFACPGNMYLFATNNNGVLYACATAKVYSCQIYDNGTLVRDLRPCYDPDGVACMYDEVSGEYFRNAGTGEFAAGVSV